MEEPGNPTTLMLSFVEDTVLIDTGSIKTAPEAPRNEEDFFLVPQSESYFVQDVVEVETERTSTWTHLCRICATPKNQLIPIFEDMGLEYDLSSKILKYLPIHVSKNDTLPLQVCYQCATMLLSWHDLTENCLNAEKKLLEMQENVLHNKREYHKSMPVLNETEISTPIAATTATLVPNIASLQPDQQDKNDDESEMHIHAEEDTNKSVRSCGARTPLRVSVDTQNAFRKRKRAVQPRARDPSAAGENRDAVWIVAADRALTDNVPSTTSEELENNDPVRLPTKRKKRDVTQKDTEREQEPCQTAAVVYKEEVHTDQIQADEIMNVDSPDSETDDYKYSCKTGTESREKEFQCTECGKRFKVKDSYLRHMRIHNDERPFTCHVCGKRFRDSGGLTRHLNDVHAKLKNFMCDLCGRSFASKATREDHRRIHTGERPYVCHSCGKTFKSKASLYIHSKLHTNEFPHACSYCSKRFRRRQELLAHVTTHTGEKNHACDVCGKKFRVKSELTRHKLIHSEEKPFACDLCKLAFRQKRYLTNHIKNRHDEPVQVLKNTMRDSFIAAWTHVSNDESATRAPDKWQTKSDTEKRINVGKIQSKVLDRKRLSSLELERSDDRSDTLSKRLKDVRRNCPGLTESYGCTAYECDVCGKMLSTSYNLLIHRNIHTGARPYICHTCDKSFRSASGLNRHVRVVHDGVKNFVCDLCDRCFASRTSRDEHRRTHTDEKPHVCEICGKLFKQKATLHVHRLYHSQILPHRCSSCGRGFRRKQELEKHSSWHSDRKPYTCDICDGRFRSKSCVTRHRNTHTDRRSYVCAICGAGFTQKRYLKRHCENVHKSARAQARPASISDC